MEVPEAWGGARWLVARCSALRPPASAWAVCIVSDFGEFSSHQHNGRYRFSKTIHVHYLLYKYRFWGGIALHNVLLSDLRVGPQWGLPWASIDRSPTGLALDYAVSGFYAKQGAHLKDFRKPCLPFADSCQRSWKDYSSVIGSLLEARHIILFACSTI